MLIEDIYNKSKSAVRVAGKLTDWFQINVEVRQGCGMSADLFNLLLEIVFIYLIEYLYSAPSR